MWKVWHNMIRPCGCVLVQARRHPLRWPSPIERARRAEAKCLESDGESFDDGSSEGCIGGSEGEPSEGCISVERREADNASRTDEVSQEGNEGLRVLGMVPSLSRRRWGRCL